MPLIERRRCCRSDLDEGPVSNECECDLSVRQWTTCDKVIVAVHQNTHHGISRVETRIGSWITDREMVNHLSLRGSEVEITMHFLIVERADACRP